MASIQKRTNGSGQVSYRVQVRMKGYPTQTATFSRVTDAKNWASQIESDMRQRRFFKTTESKKYTVADMIARYESLQQKEHPKRYENNKPMLKWWKEELGHCILADLSRAMITEKIESLSTKKRNNAKYSDQLLSPARVNRYISAFSHVCSTAYDEWEWLDQNPMQRIRRKTESRGRVRFLSDEERTALLAACKNSDNKMLYLIVVLAIATGARRGEILSLKWQDIDFKRGLITVHETKNGERRALALTGYALDEMKNYAKVRRVDTELIFPSRTGKKPASIRNAFVNAVENAGIEDFHFHDLRHSAASYLAMNGASLAEIAEVLGHKTLQMVKRYAHLSEAHTSKVVAAMNERIFG